LEMMENLKYTPETKAQRIDAFAAAVRASAPAVSERTNEEPRT